MNIQGEIQTRRVLDLVAFWCANKSELLASHKVEIDTDIFMTMKDG